MKTLGVAQFQQKRFKLLNQPEGSFKNHLGDIPAHFMMIVFGNSGNGKTEYDIQLAKYFTQFGKVLWLSYEQGHGYDLQKAVNRNNMQEVSGDFLITDPTADLPKGVTFIQDLDQYLSKRNSPDFIFIDSLDYTGFGFEEYDLLKRKFGKKKTFVFISHAKGKSPMKRIGEQIHYDGGIAVFIKDFIAYVVKNRFGGTEPHVIYEQAARERNPMFFAERIMSSVTPTDKKTKEKYRKEAEKTKELDKEPAEA